MSDLLIKDFPTLTDPQVNDDTKLMPFGIGATGKMYRGTVAQAKKVFGTYKKKYVGLGSEGVTLTLSELAGKEILQVVREGQVLHEIDVSPDTAEFVWDTTDITLGLSVNIGERYLILYKNG